MSMYIHKGEEFLYTGFWLKSKVSSDSFFVVGFVHLLVKVFVNLPRNANKEQTTLKCVFRS